MRLIKLHFTLLIRELVFFCPDLYYCYCEEDYTGILRQFSISPLFIQQNVKIFQKRG